MPTKRQYTSYNVEQVQISYQDFIAKSFSVEIPEDFYKEVALILMDYRILSMMSGVTT